MATTIGSTFDIITELAAGQTTTNIAKPARACRVIGIYGTGLTTGTITVSKVAALGTGAVVQLGVVTLDAAVAGLNDAPAVLDALANRTLLATDWLRIVRAVADSTRIVIRCEAAAPIAVVES
jgi:hypothetical protein